VRGAALVATVAYHLGHLSGGFLGVDVFFVLSGFLVTSLLLAEARGRSSVAIGAFWLARLRRLGPAVLAVTPTVLVMAWAVGWPSSRFDELAVDGAATLTWWQNWHQIVAGQSYWDPSPSPLRHTWSLAVEEQFYLVWPAAAALLLSWAITRRRAAARTVGMVAMTLAVSGAVWHLALAHRVDDAGLSRVYLGTDTRAFALLAGCALACTRWGLTADRSATAGRGTSRLLSAGGATGLVGLALLVVSQEVDDPALFRRGGFVVTAVLALAVVAHQAAVEGEPLLARLGTGPVGRSVGAASVTLGWLGRRSYGIYLWSWPIQVLATHRWPDQLQWTRSVLVVAASLTLAEVSFRVLEEPLRRRTGWASTPARRRPVWMGGVAVSALVVVLVAGAATTAPVHERLETADALDLALEPPTTAEPGAGGDEGLGVLVLGDSVSFTVGLYKPPPLALPEGVAWVDSRAVIGCGLLAAAGWEYPGGRSFAPPSGGDCVGQARAERLGLAQRPDVVVMFPGAWEVFSVRSPGGEVVQDRTPRMAEVLEAALVTRARAARDAGAAFLVVGWACPGEGTPPARRDPVFVRWVNDVFRSAMAAARSDGVDARYVEPGAESCNGGPTGRPTVAKQGWMADSNHVIGQEQGERFWRDWLAPVLAREFATR
jgi:peptidoglycan/LPS O-acetylase OafA/YrhL